MSTNRVTASRGKRTRARIQGALVYIYNNEKGFQDIRLVSLSFNTFIPRLKQVPSFPSCPLVLISTPRKPFQMGSPPQYRNNEMCDFHVGTTDQSSRTSTLFLRIHTLLSQETNIAADNVPENTV